MKKILLAGVISVLLLGACSKSDSSSGGAKSASGEIPSMSFELGHPGAASEANQQHHFAVRFQEELSALSGGKLVLNIHPAGELGGEREMLESVQLGTLHFAFVSTGPLGNFVPDVYAFDFPFLFKDFDHAQRVLDGALGDQLIEKVKGEGIEIVVWGENGIRQLLNSKRSIYKPGDIGGLKIRTMENKVHMDTFRKLGADPTPISTAELYTALQQGVVDAMEGPITWMVPGKFTEVQKYMTISNHFYTPSILASNLAAMQKLPANVRQIIQQAAETARDKQRAYIRQADADLIKQAQSEGVTVVDSSQFDRDAFIQATASVYTDLGKPYESIINQIRAAE